MDGTQTPGFRASREELARTVETLCSFGEKVPGSEAERRAAEFIAGRLAEYGIAHKVLEFDNYISEPVFAKLFVTAPESREIEAVGVGFAQSTGEAGIEAEVVYVGRGGEADFAGKDVRGKIVLADTLPGPGLGVLAAGAGAVGMICCSGGKQRHKMTLSPVWGSPGASDAHRLPKIVCASINKSDGESLRALAQRGGLRARIVARTDEGWRRVRLPYAEIAGQEPDYVLFGSHYCTWWQGATDNITGNALILEVARLLKQRQSTLRYGVRFAWWPGHTHGRYSGSAWFADHHWHDLNDHCITYFNVDSPGVRGTTLRIPRNQTGEMAAFNMAMLDALGMDHSEHLHSHRPDKYLDATRVARNSDQTFWGLGLSSIQVVSMLPTGHPDRAPGIGGCGGAWWWHAIEDTPEKADVDVLAVDSELHAAIADRLATATVLPLQFAATAQDYQAKLREYIEAAGERIDLSRAMELAQELETKAAALHGRAQSLSDPADTQRYNRKLLQLARVLHPTLWQERSRFEHDPALSLPALPGLAPCMKLAALSPDSDMHKALLVDLKRQLNRVEHALIEAIRLIDTHS